MSDFIANRNRLESFDSHLYKSLKLSHFPKSLTWNKHILNRLEEYSQIPKDVSKSFLENTSTPSGDDILKCIKRKRLNINVSPISMQKGSRHSELTYVQSTKSFETLLREYW